jgi:hypothetical protein
VSAVAEWSPAGLAAAAESDCRLVGRDFEFRAARVDELEWALDDERAVRAHANRDVGHGECSSVNAVDAEAILPDCQSQH